MNHQDKSSLEAAIDRELKQLAPITAPPTLITKVLAQIEQPEPMRSTRSSWTNWPLRWRVASFAGLAMLFGALGFGLWFILQLPSVGLAGAQLAQSLSAFKAIWNAVPVLLGAAVVAVGELGAVFIVASLMLIGVAYLACIGMGTMLVRFAVVRH